MGRRIQKIRRWLALFRVRYMFIYLPICIGIEKINIWIFNFLAPLSEALAIAVLAAFYAFLFRMIFKTRFYKKILKPTIKWLNEVLTELWTLVCRKRAAHYGVLIIIFFLIYYLNLLNIQHGLGNYSNNLGLVSMMAWVLIFMAIFAVEN